MATKCFLVHFLEKCLAIARYFSVHLLEKHLAITRCFFEKHLVATMCFLIYFLKTCLEFTKRFLVHLVENHLATARSFIASLWEMFGTNQVFSRHIHKKHLVVIGHFSGHLQEKHLATAKWFLMHLCEKRMASVVRHFSTHFLEKHLAIIKHFSWRLFHYYHIYNLKTLENLLWFCCNFFKFVFLVHFFHCLQNTLDLFHKYPNFIPKKWKKMNIIHKIGM